jgi:hypothetical protein
MPRMKILIANVAEFHWSLPTVKSPWGQFRLIQRVR